MYQPTIFQSILIRLQIWLPTYCATRTRIIQSTLFLNPFQTNGIFYKATYTKVRNVHCIYLWVTGYSFQKYIVFLSLKISFVLANSADPDEMPQCAAFHLGLHCLPKYPFKGFQFSKGQTIQENTSVSPYLRKTVLSISIICKRKILIG